MPYAVLFSGKKDAEKPLLFLLVVDREKQRVQLDSVVNQI